jgi:hypothetical protein
VRVAQLHVAANDARILSELRFPQLVTQHRRERNTEPVVLRGESAADDRADAKKREDVGRDHAAIHQHGFAVSRERLRAARVRRDRVERTELVRSQYLRERLVRDIARASARRRGDRGRSGRCFAEDDEPIGVDEGERAEPNGVDDAERGDARTHGDRERTNGGHEEAGAS